MTIDYYLLVWLCRSGALCFMHLVSGRSLKKLKIKNLQIFFNGLGHWLSESGWVDLKKKKKKKIGWVTSQPILSSSKKKKKNSGSGQVFLGRVGLGQVRNF